ncbi:MAG: 3-oxoacyl-ACP reductase FabG [Burkholderiales bacterium]|nr:3-oxoacyl-ACP reductase FabG [Burkholderiales bacterium]
MKLAGKVAIVTGGATGIGKALATRLAEDGAVVVIADIRGADTAAAEHIAAGRRAIGIATDVSDEGATRAMAEAALRAFGRIDILVNNAAVFSVLTPGPFEAIPAADWKRVMEVNTLGPFLCVKAVAPHLRAQRSGRIINLASGAPLKGIPGMLHYVSSKGAVIAFTRALARELGPDNITVNALAPGFTLSEGVLENSIHVDKFREVIIKSRSIPRDETPQDLVGALSFLASDDSAFMTGQTVVVDGGSAFV